MLIAAVLYVTPRVVENAKIAGSYEQLYIYRLRCFWKDMRIIRKLFDFTLTLKSGLNYLLFLFKIHYTVAVVAVMDLIKSTLTQLLILRIRRI